jgi:Protein of unknown function (DUF2283)
VKQLLEMTSEGTHGPAYLYFAREKVATTEPCEDEEDVVVDYAEDGSVIGVELVSICPETITALGNVARRFDLDLGPLFARPIEPHAA